MHQFKVWEVGIYQAQLITAETMRAAVARFAGVTCLKLYGDSKLSSPSNTAGWIASDGSAREFHCYEIH